MCGNAHSGASVQPTFCASRLQLISSIVGFTLYDASEHRERARRSDRADEAMSESACPAVRGAKLSDKTSRSSSDSSSTVTPGDPSASSWACEKASLDNIP